MRNSPKRSLLVSYKILFGLFGFSSIVTEIAVLVERSRFVPFNFFSFFTIESNLFAVVILGLSALALTRGAESKVLTMLRGANTLNMVVVGIIFPLLLSGLKNVEFTAVPWDNIVLHYIMPIAVALDWFIDRPKNRISIKQASLWLLFPIAYVAYSLIRGHLVDWYPYPFLDPGKHGYAGVAAYSVGIALVAFAVSFAIRGVGNKQASQAR